MTLLHDAVEQKKKDIRIIERNQLRGLQTGDEMERLAKDLSDDAENATYISMEEIIEQQGKETVRTVVRSHKSAVEHKPIEPIENVDGDPENLVS